MVRGTKRLTEPLYASIESRRVTCCFATDVGRLSCVPSRTSLLRPLIPVRTSLNRCRFNTATESRTMFSERQHKTKSLTSTRMILSGRAAVTRLKQTEQRKIAASYLTSGFFAITELARWQVLWFRLLPHRPATRCFYLGTGSRRSRASSCRIHLGEDFQFRSCETALVLSEALLPVTML